MDIVERQGGYATATAGVGDSKFSKIISWLLALVVFATPLMFTPFTSEVREFNKITFIFLAVVVMLGLWVIRILTTRAVSWVKTTLDYILLAYTLIFLASSFLSLDKVSSFLGYYGRFSGSFLSMISLIVLYYIIVNNVRDRAITNKLINALIYSGLVVLVYSLLQMFGLYLLPFSFAKTAAFNPIGSLVSLGIFAALMVTLVQWAWLARQNSRIDHVVYTVISLSGLLILFFVNAFSAWLILTLGMIVFIALAMTMTGNSTSQSWIWRPLLVLVVGILFVGFQFLPNSVNPRNWVGSSVKLPVEIQLSNSATWEMVKNSLTEKPILGFGPGTTGIAFGQIKPETLNQSIVWSLNFDRASSEVANIAIETGLLGLLAFEATSVLFLLYALFFLMKKVDHPGRMHAFGIFVLWLGLYISHFFYFYNATMYFLFWVSLALFVAITHWQEGTEDSRGLSFNESPRSALSWMFASLLILAVLLVGGFFQIAVFFADTSYASGLKELAKENPDLSKSSQSFLSAIQRNQYRDVYYLAYGQSLVFRAAQEIRKDNPDANQFQGWIRDLIAAGNTATELSPNKASNWAARSQFYSQIRALSVPGTDEVIISSAEEAVKKDDRNPILLLQLAQAYSNAAETIDPKVVSGGTDTDGDGLSDENERSIGSNERNSDSNGNGISDGDEVKAGFNPAGTGRLNSAQLQKFTKIDMDKLRKAEESLKRAIELKSNLPDSYVSLARVYERSNKLEDARKTLEQGTKILPNNADIKYELGRIIFNLKDFGTAESIFNDVIKLVPNHANAHYSLGLVALQKQDRARALAEFEKTLEITGENTELQKLIDNLKNPPAETQPTQIQP
ncbi:MAG: tetratricopeptide repeat protein [Candidatus Doudnabacteria bacterium]|nr:tetratricopeptide repeat protein [Candidatus Doudnabacteria bacterium]